MTETKESSAGAEREEVGEVSTLPLDSTTVNIDMEVWNELNKRRKRAGETFNNVLRRLLGLRERVENVQPENR